MARATIRGTGSPGLSKLRGACRSFGPTGSIRRLEFGVWRTGNGARRGALVLGFVFLALLLGAIVVVMAVSSQSSSGRAVNTAVATGRYATELAESAVDECLSEFTDVVAGQFPSDNRRQDLISRAKGGTIGGPELFGIEAFEFVPYKTLSLVEQAKVGILVSPVKLKPIYYSLIHNYGELELSCATSHLVGRRQIYRRVSSRHYIILNTDGRTFRINHVASRFVVDRSQDR